MFVIAQLSDGTCGRTKIFSLTFISLPQKMTMIDSDAALNHYFEDIINRCVTPLFVS